MYFLFNLARHIVFTLLHQLASVRSSSRPGSVKVIPYGASHAKVKWSAPSTYEGKLTGYSVLYTQDRALVDRKWNKIRVNDRSTECVIKDLFRFVLYYIKVKPVFDDTITGQASDVIEFSLVEQEHSDQMMAKIDRVVTGIYPSIVQVYWRVPDLIDGKLFQYQIYYAKKPLNKNSKDLKVEVIDKNKKVDFDREKEFETKLFGLEPDTEYEFMIKVKSSDNMIGINSELFQYQTKPDKKSSSDQRRQSSDSRPDGLIGLIYLVFDFCLWTVLFVGKACILLSPIFFLYWVVPRHQGRKVSNLQKASQLFNRGEYEEARRYYKLALEHSTYPDDEQARIVYNVAVCSMRLFEFMSVVKWCRKAIKLDPDHLKSYKLMGDTFTTMKRFAEAVQVYEMLCVKDPSDENFTLLEWARLRVHGEQSEESEPEVDEPPKRGKTRDECFVILGLLNGSSQDLIKKAYRRKIMECHPDKHVNATREEKLMWDEKAKEINGAYTLLTSDLP